MQCVLFENTPVEPIVPMWTVDSSTLVSKNDGLGSPGRTLFYLVLAVVLEDNVAVVCYFSCNAKTRKKRKLQQVAAVGWTLMDEGTLTEEVKTKERKIL